MPPEALFLTTPRHPTFAQASPTTFPEEREVIASQILGQSAIAMPPAGMHTQDASPPHHMFVASSTAVGPTIWSIALAKSALCELSSA